MVNKEKQRGSPLLDANKHTLIYISNIDKCILYVYNLFVETIVSKDWPSSSVFFVYKYYFSWGQYRLDIENFFDLS